MATDVLSRPAPPPDLILRYGPEPEHVIDVRLPRAGVAAPLVLFLHGGFWMAEYDRLHVGPLAADLAARGYAVALPEYRRIGQPGGGWPGTLDDVAAAIDKAPSLVAAAAPGRVDITRTVLAGHSAGGHLALWSAGRHNLPTGHRWRPRSRPSTIGVLALAPVSNLIDGYHQGIGDGAVGQLMGCGPDGADGAADRYASADPTQLRVDAPVMIVHGSADDRVPVQMSRQYARATGASLVELPDVDHFAVIDPLSRIWPAVVESLAGLVRGRH